MASQAIETQGTLIAIAVGSPTSFSNIGNITDFTGPGGQASVIDKSDLNSVAREKLMGLPDEGQFSFNGNFKYSAQQTLIDARKARTRCELRITFTDSVTATFFGYILGFVVSGGVDAVVKAAVTIEIDGAVTWA